MIRSWYKAFEVGAGLWLLLVMATLSTPAHAAELAKARAALDTALPVWVGQQVAFHVDLLSPTFFSGTPTFDVPNLPSAVLMKVDERPTLSTEQIDGMTYSIQRHAFVLFPQRAGTLVVPAFQVRFEVAPAFGKPPVAQNVTLGSLKVEVEMPPGADGLSMLISTTDLIVDDQWSPALSADRTLHLKVGDALTRTLTRRATDVTGMVFPPVSFGSHNGLGVYPKPPDVEDSTQRGDFTGQRVDTVTYICETVGTYRLPALSMPWFDVDDAQLKRVELPAVTLEVVENPKLAVDAPMPQTPQPRSIANVWWWLGGVVVIISIVAWWLPRVYRPLVTRFSIWRSRRTERETAYFARLKTACQSGDPAMAYEAFTHWIDCMNDGNGVDTIHQFVHHAEDAILRDQTEQLEQRLFAASATPREAWSGQLLYQRLAAVRKQMHPRTTRFDWQAQQALPPLNPSVYASVSNNLDNRSKPTPA
jgi:hypothetical protein